jgi:hypothetical protein
MDDDYEYQQTKRAYHRNVAFMIIGVLCTVGLLVVRFALRREPSYPTPVHIPPPAPTAAALPIARDPIEFELTVGSDKYDVVPDKIVDVKGTLLTFEQNPTWLASGDGFHFKHRSTVSVLSTPEMVIASIDGALAKFQVLDPKLSDAAAKKLLSDTLTSTGLTVDTTKSTRTIAGKSREGVRHKTSTQMEIEAYLVRLGKTSLGIYFYIQDAHADLANVNALLADLAEGPGQQLPEFTAKLDATSTPIFIDKPATVGPVMFTLRHRPTILRTMIGNGGSLTFEQPRGLTVSRMPNNLMLVVSLQSDRGAIQLFDLGMKFTVDELKSSMMGEVAVTDLGEVTRGTGANAIRGRKLRLANLPVQHELYVVERGGKTIGAGIQYVPSDEEAAIAIALPVLMSVH